ncbi:multicopper oxidase family protein [Alsobacter sp. R-9]
MAAHPKTFSLTRRRFAAGLGGAAALPLLPAAAVAQKAPATAAPAASPLPADGLPTVLLEAKPSFVAFQPGQETELWAFGGKAPGPDIRTKRGEDFRVRVVNGIKRPLSVHWHGVRGPNEADGVAGLTQEATAPGATADVRFVPPDAGTFIYRPLVPGMTGELQERGLAGVLAVTEPDAPPVDVDRIVAVDDWRLDAEGRHAAFELPEERAGAGRLGTILTVNGMRAPLKLSVPPGSRVRLRLASLCNARLMRIRFDGMKAYVIAVDSQPTDTFEPLRSTLPFAPGSRYDVLFDVPAEPGATAAVTALIGEGLPLVQVTAEGDPAITRRPVLPPIGPLAPNRLLPEAITLQKAQRADVVIEGGVRPGASDGRGTWTGDPQRIWTVNGVSGAIGADKPGKPVLSVKRGTPVVLAMTNRTAFPQVLHVHGHCFRLLHAFDDGWEPYWLDTMILLENQTQRIAFVADNRGKWLIGSTVLERLDTGLSCWFEVT